MILKIDAGDGQLVEQVKCNLSTESNGVSLQIVGLSSAGGEITVEQSVDGEHFTQATIGGVGTITSDDTYHILRGNYVIRVAYTGSSQGDIKIIVR